MTENYRFHHVITLKPYEMYESHEGYRIHNYSVLIIAVEVRALPLWKPWWETLAEGYYSERGLLCSCDC